MNQVDESRRVEDAAARLNSSLLALSRCNRLLWQAREEQELLQSICQILVETAGVSSGLVTAKTTPRRPSVQSQGPVTAWITWTASRSPGAIRTREEDRSAMPSGQQGSVGSMISARTRDFRMGEPRLRRWDIFPVLHFPWSLMRDRRVFSICVARLPFMPTLSTGAKSNDMRIWH